MGEPEFTVVLPTYNRPLMLRRAIASVLAQTWKSFELVVIDDASDPAAKLPDDMEDSRVKIVQLARNGGPARACNAGLQLARGRWISILNDDDEFHPQFLERTRRALMDNPSASFSWCSVRTVDLSSARSVSAAVDRVFPAAYASEEALLLDALSIGGGFGLTLCAEVIRTLGGYDPAYTVTEDAELLYRLLAAGFRPTVVPDVLVTIYNHGQDRLTDSRFDRVRADECVRLLERYAPFIGSYRSLDTQLRGHITRLQANLATC